MILVGRYRSPYVRRVAVTMRQLGLDYERRLITAWDDLDGVTGINPVGRVPALILDDGEVIVESSFIIDVVTLFVRERDPDMMPAGRFPNLEAMMERCEALPVFQETQPEI
jgi:glutathione S-transferase